MELSCLGKGSVSYGLGADFSLPHCLVPGGQVSESNLEPSPAGISDPRAEISGWIVMVRRSGNVSRGTATGCIFSLLLAFGLRMRRCQLALKHTMWKAQWLHFSNRLMTSILRLTSRTRALWEKGFYPSPMHAHSSSLARDDASLAPATPTQVVSEGERNPSLQNKVGAMYRECENAE